MVAQSNSTQVKKKKKKKKKEMLKKNEYEIKVIFKQCSLKRDEALFVLNKANEVFDSICDRHSMLSLGNAAMS